MRFRKLRITWTVFCGIACVLLIVLWVRSYSWADFARCPLGTQRTIQMGSSGGRLILRAYGNNNSRSFTDKSGGRATISVLSGWGRTTTAQRSGVQFTTPLFTNNSGQLYDTDLMFPHWLLVIVGVASAAIPWLRWRFSLRTLLIATTLVAVVLGLIVWATR